MKLTEAKLKRMILEFLNEEKEKVDSRYVFKKTFEALGEDATDENLQQLFVKYKSAYLNGLDGQDSRTTAARNNDFVRKIDAELNKQWKKASESYKDFWDNFQFWHTLNFITNEDTSSNLFKSLVSGEKLPAPVSCWGGPGSDEGFSKEARQILASNVIMSKNVAVCLKGNVSMGSSQDINTEIYSSFKNVEDVKKSADFSKIVSLDSLIVGPNDKVVGGDPVNEFVLYNAEFAGKVYLPYKFGSTKIMNFTTILNKITGLSDDGLLGAFRVLENTVRKPFAKGSFLLKGGFEALGGDEAFAFRTLLYYSSGLGINDHRNIDKNLFNILKILRRGGDVQVYTQKGEEISEALKELFLTLDQRKPERILKRLYAKDHATNYFAQLLNKVNPPEYQLYKKWLKIFQQAELLWKIIPESDKDFFFGGWGFRTRGMPAISVSSALERMRDFVKKKDFSEISEKSAWKMINLLRQYEEELYELEKKTGGRLSDDDVISNGMSMLFENKKIKLKIIT